jgi:hypothetical protein
VSQIYIPSIDGSAYHIQFLVSFTELRCRFLIRIKRNPALCPQLNQFHLQTTSPRMALPLSDNHYPIFEAKRSNIIDWI